MIATFHLERGIPSKYKSLTCVGYVPALCTHRPSLLPIECLSEFYGLVLSCWIILWPFFLLEVGWSWSQFFKLEVGLTWALRGSKSRNKVFVGEPAEGSLLLLHYANMSLACLFLSFFFLCLFGFVFSFSYPRPPCSKVANVTECMS